MLSSGGTAPIAATIGWAGGTPDPREARPCTSTLAEPQKIAFLAKGYLVSRRPAGRPPHDYPIPSTRAPPSQDIDKAAGTVTLSKPLRRPSKDCAFTFNRPVDDYASEAMIKLWYSWAQYYLAHWKDRTPGAPTAPTPITGSIETDDGDADFQQSAPRVGPGHGGNRPRSGRRRDREGSPPG